MQLSEDVHGAELAALRWLVELGVDETICDAPIDRFEVKPAAPDVQPESAQGVVRAKKSDREKAAETLAVSVALAEGCLDLAALRVAMGEFDGCVLKKGARNLVFGEGNPQARVMVIGDAPGRNEDQKGMPFVGASGQLLDRMFGAIGLSRASKEAEKSIYITNLMPWRPPQDRELTAGEVAVMLPFLRRHIELVDPRVVVVMGSVSAGALVGVEGGMTRLRGTWAEVGGRAYLPMFHPETLLKAAEKKRFAWADLLAIDARLVGLSK